MLDTLLTKALELGDRCKKPISWAGAVWLFISAASWVPWMPIPEIPYVTDSNSWVLSGAWNAIWWGLAYPALDKHRAKLEAEHTKNSSETGQDTAQES